MHRLDPNFLWTLWVFTWPILLTIHLATSVDLRKSLRAEPWLDFAGLVLLGLIMVAPIVGVHFACSRIRRWFHDHPPLDG